MRFLLLILAALGLMLFPQTASAQNTSGVFGPTVSADDHNLQLRLAVSSGDGTKWAQRLHYERALSDNFRPRIVLQTRERNGNQFDLDFVRLEAVWQLTPDERSHQMGLRFEGRVRTEGAEEVRANFINQWSLGNGWRARAIWLNTLQVADRSNTELQFSSRLGLSRKMEQGFRLGLHGFFDLGDTSGLNVLNDRVDSEMGPFIAFDVLENTSLYLGTLHGLTDASPDTQLRVFITQAF